MRRLALFAGLVAGVAIWGCEGESGVWVRPRPSAAEGVLVRARDALSPSAAPLGDGDGSLPVDPGQTVPAIGALPLPDASQEIPGDPAQSGRLAGRASAVPTSLPWGSDPPTDPLTSQAGNTDHEHPTVPLVYVSGTTATPTPRPAPPALFAPGEAFVAVSNRDGNNELYRFAADGSSAFRLTADSAQDLSPRLSVDGREVVWTTTRRAGLTQVYQMWLDGSQLRSVTIGPRLATEPVYAPDRGQIAFIRPTSSTSAELHLIDSTGYNERAIGPSGYRLFSPVWSPDGQRIAVVRADAAGRTAIFSYAVDGQGERNLTAEQGNANVSGRLSWGANGKLAFAADWDGGGLGIVVMNGDGTGKRQLTHGDEQDPSWRPDGLALLATAKEGSGTQIIRLNPDGTGRTVLTQGPGSTFQGSW